MKIYYLPLFTLILFCLSAQKEKQFPTFQYTSIEGATINNSIFTGKESMVILGRLGCYPLMLLLKDLQDTTFSQDFQTILILEDTNQQILDFNSPTSNLFSRMRFKYKLNPLRGYVVGECDKEKLTYPKGDTLILNHPSILAKKLKTNDSPSTYFVNSQGLIERSFKGYFNGGSKKFRLQTLFAGTIRVDKHVYKQQPVSK
jgi:hypothetical protein